MSGAIDHAGRPSAYRPPVEEEGRLPDRGNPRPLDRLSPAAAVVVEIIALGVGLLVGVGLAPHGVPVWAAPVLVGAVALALLVRTGDTSVLDRIARRFRGSRVLRPTPEPQSVDLPDGTALGIIRDGGHLLSVLAVREDTPPVVVEGTRNRPVVPVDALVDHLSRYDITLHSIDLTAGVPGPGTTSRAAWVTLRFDPARDADAVERRGGGDDGAVRTLVTATRRLALRLGGEGLSVTALDPAAITRARARFTLAEGAGVATIVHPRSAFGPGDAGSAPDDGRLPDVTWLSLRGRDRAGRVHWRGAVGVRPGERAPAGTAPLTTDLETAFDAMLPGAAYAESPRVRFRPLLDRVPDLAGYSPALGDRGPLLGVDAEGRGVRIGLRGPDHRVALAVSPHTVRQLVLRTLRGGSMVEVITDAPTRWEEMRHPDLLVRSPGDHGGSSDAPALVVVEGDAAPPVREATVLTVSPLGAEPPRSAVTITEHSGAAAGAVTVVSDGRALDVGLIELPGEAEVIGRAGTSLTM